MIARIVDLSRWVLYDQKIIGDRPSSLHFFLNPWGMNSESDRWECPYLRTNMVLVSQLPAPNRFLVWRLNALFFRDDLALPLSATSLYARTGINFRILSKSYWQGPAWSCISPLALFTTPKEDIPQAEKAIGIPWTQIGASFATRIAWDKEKKESHGGLSIDNREPFEVIADVDPANNDPETVLAIYLDGPCVRAVI